MNEILFSWVGTADLNGVANIPATGPLVSVLGYRSFSHAFLLHNQPLEVVSPLFVYLQQEFDTKIFPIQAELRTPTHFADIYRALNGTMEQVVKDYPSSRFFIQLTSGTPAMTSVSILTGKTKYQVEFLQSSLEQGVQFVDIPFDIAADFMPSVAGALDSRLSELMASEAPSTAAFDQIISEDPQMHRLKQRAAILAAREVPVLIHGETGTGKELFARAIHNTSNRSQKPFLSLNCGAIPTELIDATLFGYVKGAFTGATSNKLGIFAETNGGTLFLDEFGELPLEAQVRLLRVLQNGTYLPVGSTEEHSTDVRIIAATNRNLSEEVAQGRFREDLFYRVAIGIINLPPLRLRKGDKWFLAEHLLKEINREAAGQPGYAEKKISAGAKKVILNHGWPGNVRELHATLLRASLWGVEGKISESDMKEAMLTAPVKGQNLLDQDVSQGVDINAIIRDVSVHYIEQALAESNGSKSKASELLGIKNYQTLNNWIEKYGIK